MPLLSNFKITLCVDPWGALGRVIVHKYAQYRYSPLIDLSSSIGLPKSLSTSCFVVFPLTNKVFGRSIVRPGSAFAKFTFAESSFVEVSCIFSSFLRELTLMVAC